MAKVDYKESQSMNDGMPEDRSNIFVNYVLLARIEGRDWRYLDKLGYGEEIPSVDEWVCRLDEDGQPWQRGWKDHPCEFLIVKEYEAISIIRVPIEHIASETW